MKIECPIYDCSCPYFVAGDCYKKEMDGAYPGEECNPPLEEEDYEEEEWDYEMGFDPYLGCYTDDC